MSLDADHATAPFALRRDEGEARWFLNIKIRRQPNRPTIARTAEGVGQASSQLDIGAALVKRTLVQRRVNSSGVDPAVRISAADSTAKLFGWIYGAELLKTA